MYSPRKRKQKKVFAQECKDLFCMVRVLRQEFDKLKELFYELQASKGEE
jgi:hypothetical protein